MWLGIAISYIKKCSHKIMIIVLAISANIADVTFYHKTITVIGINLI